MSPVEVFATRIKIFDQQKVNLMRDHLFKNSWLLDVLRVKGRFGAAQSWSFDFQSLEITLIHWLACKKDFYFITSFNFDPSRKHFYNWTYKWLHVPLERVEGGSGTRLVVALFFFLSCNLLFVVMLYCHKTLKKPGIKQLNPLVGPG